MTLTLHDYWRSGAAYRVRIALNLKGIEYRQIAHDLRVGAQREADYLAVAPQGLVPAIEEGPFALTQSPAILEWINERWPEPPLLPRDAASRAMVRAMASLVSCDIHPLNNLRVLRVLRDELRADERQVNAWIGRWIRDGFTALEVLVKRHGGLFAWGDSVSLADCCLAPQIYSAQRFNVDLAEYPTLLRVSATAGDLPAFRSAHPTRQPDADPS